jgi:hypothetical protein
MYSLTYALNQDRNPSLPFFLLLLPSLPRLLPPAVWEIGRRTNVGLTHRSLVNVLSTLSWHGSFKFLHESILLALFWR